MSDFNALFTIMVLSPCIAVALLGVVLLVLLLLDNES
jgi:hypothetical protein